MAAWQASATQIAAMLAAGEASASEVLKDHLDRIDTLDGRLHAFTEVFHEQSKVDAAASDGRRRRSETRGPLDGVPVSIKECFDVAGRATTLGLPSRRGHVAERDSAVVTLLREAGAVLVGRTNLSQTMFFVEARNPIFGQTANPWSLDRSPGGSSGGEAAAIASGMSPLGVGTDIGGSIRTPAHFCGICGLKPTLDRLPMRGYQSVVPGQEAVRGAAGPLARTVTDLALFFRAIPGARSSELDPQVPTLAWQEPATVRLAGLGVGYYTDDGILPASRSIARAVERAADVLRARGCNVQPFPPPGVRAALAAYLGALSADGGEAVLRALAGGEIDPVLDPLRRLARLPAVLRRIAVHGAKALGQESLSLLLESMGRKTVGEFWLLTERLRAARATLLDAMDARGIELLVCPPYATCALPHGGSKNFTLASSYSILFNVTDMPAGTVPVTRVQNDEEGRPSARDALVRHAAQVDRGSSGLPVGVQVVGRPWCDHVVLAAMHAIETDVSGGNDFPTTPVEPTRGTSRS